MLRLPNPLDWTATELAAAIRAKSLSAAEYVTLLQKHCDAHADLGGFIAQDFTKLRAAAKRADEKLARDPASCGPLHGVPIALKDNIDTTELPTSGGTPALRTNVPPRNAPVWQSLADAGALLAGKANMHELASGGSTDNVAFARAKNPYDPSRTAGGSSGGSGVIVAARLAPVALGSDTGGSIRVPAALCGVAGLRPTHGRYSNVGIVPLAPSFDTAGPLARSIADLALVDGAVTGQRAPLRDINPRDVRLGVDRKRFFDAAKPEIRAVVDKALAKLTDAGVTLVELDADPERATAMAASGVIYDTERQGPLEAYLAESAAGVTVDQVWAAIGSPALKKRLDERAAKPAADPEAYRKALTETLPALRAAHARMMTEHRLDALIASATPEGPLPFGGDDSVVLDGKVVSSWMYFTATSYAPPRGLPSLALPAGLTPLGLPVGLFLDGHHGGDRELLAVARMVEQVLAVDIRPPGF